MWTASAGILLAFCGIASAIPVSKEGKTDQNNLDYQIDPQVLNYHLQQLLLDQEQQSKQSQQAQQLQPQTTPYPAQDQQYQAQIQQLQAQYQQQFQQQLQQLQSQQYQGQLDSKTSQSSLQIPQSNSLPINPYQQPLPLQYQQPLTQGQGSAQDYQQQQPVQPYQQPSVQYVQPSAQEYQQQPSQQAQKQGLLGVAYSSAVDASKTSFSGYGIKYSF